MSASEPRITVLGSLHLDILVRAPDRPRKGETLAGSEWWRKAGGKGGNQAVAVRRHGVVVSMIGCVGSDDFGELLVRNLDAAGVDTRHVRRADDAGSGMSVAIIDDSGDYGAVIVSGVNLLIDETDLVRAESTIAASRLLLLQHEVNDSANVGAAQMAARHRCPVLLNAAPAKRLAPELATRVDILVANAVEAEMMGSAPVTDLNSAVKAARHLRELAPVAIVTAGSHGVAAAAGVNVIHALPALTVSVTSTHGAGDVFVGALAARLARDEELGTALRYANAAAARHVSS